VRDIKVDWEGTYEKFAKLYARLMKRAKRDMEAAEDGSGEDNGGAPRVRQPQAANPMAQRILSQGVVNR
jgi:hypothetical protein